MTTEIQPIDPRIPFYIPENWIQSTGSGGGSFITYPTAQTANILFPGSISCSNLKSFAPSAPMNLYNDSTSGNIEIANNFGYTGGIVINADSTPPVAGKIIIGDSARALVAPLIETNVLQGNGISFIDVESDLNVNTGYAVYTNSLQRVSGKNLNIGTDILDVTINIGTAAGSDDTINIGTGMTSAGNINLGGALGTTNALNFESSLITCKNNNALSIGTFVGRTTDINIGTGMTSGNLNLGGANSITNANKLESQFISCEADKALNIGRFASRITPISIGNLGLGDGTTTGSIFIGAGNNSSTSSISLGSSTLENNYVRGKTLRLNDEADAVSTIIGSTYTGNTVTVNAPTTLNKPVSLSVTSDPPVPDNTYRVPSTSWVNTAITNALSGLSGYATYAGTTAFSALQTFNLGIATNTITLISGTSLSLPASTVTAPGAADNSTRVPTTAWITTEGFGKKSVENLWTAKQQYSDVIRVNDIAGYSTATININQAVVTAPLTGDGSDRVVSSQWVRDQGFVSSTTGFARYDAALPTASFDYRNEFKNGIKTAEIELYTTAGATALTLPNIKTNAITSSGTLTIDSTSLSLNAPLAAGLEIGYSPYTSSDTYIGSSKSMTYTNAGLSMPTGGIGNLYVFGNISTLAAGTYQVNMKLKLQSNNTVNPLLNGGLYTKTGTTAWVNAAVLSGGTLVNACSFDGFNYAPNTGYNFTRDVCGLANFTTEVQVCIAFGFNLTSFPAGQLSGTTYLSLFRLS